MDWHTANQFCLNRSQTLLPNDLITEEVYDKLVEKKIHPLGTLSTIKQNLFEYTDSYWKASDGCACNVTINQCLTEDYQGCTRKAAILCYEKHVPGIHRL